MEEGKFAFSLCVVAVGVFVVLQLSGRWNNRELSFTRPPKPVLPVICFSYQQSVRFVIHSLIDVFAAVLEADSSSWLHALSRSTTQLEACIRET